MEQSLIELKENDSVKTQDENNGEYRISLKKNLVLNPNDELVIKNVFIDTIASSGGLIVLEEDTTATIKFCRAFTFNTGITNNTSGNTANSLKEPDNGYLVNKNIANRDTRILQCELERDGGTKKGDSLSYFQLEKKTIAGGNNFIQANTLTFFSDISSKGYSGHFGGTSVSFAFEGIDGNIQEISIELLNADGSASDLSKKQDITSFVYNTTWKGDGRGYLNGNIELLTSNDTLEHHNLSPDFDFEGVPVPAGDYFNLKQESLSFTIPKGAYDPNDLARIITDSCVKRPNNQFPTFDSTSVQVFPFSTPMYNRANNQSSDLDDSNIYFLSYNSEVLLNLQHGNNNLPICGCNQFSFVFDEDTRTFKFVSLHTPFYADISSGGQSNLQIGTEYSIRGNSNNDIKTPFIDTKRGEIVIMGLSAFDENNKEIDFWYGKLGINPNILIEGHQNYQNFRYGTPGGDVTVKIPQINLIEGVNSTNAFLGADSILNNSVLVPVTASYTANIKTANLMTTPIFGLKTLGQITDTQGYFLIEISGFNNDVRLIGENNINANISAIVSRYYASTSYTNGYIQDSISYIHKGDPITLSDFKIRILDPAHKVSSDIGNDSSVFLMINRASEIPEKK